MRYSRKAQSHGYAPGERRWTGYLYILPGLSIYALFVLWPVFNSVRLSFYHWDGYSTPIFRGLGNYAELLADQVFLNALRNNLKFMAFYTLVPIALALFLAALLTYRRLPGMTYFRVALFLPYVMSMVVVGVVWMWIYNPVFGPLNEMLRAIGLEAWTRPWLGDFDLALPAIGIMGAWVHYGFCMVLFIAGVQHIDESLYDAAKIDGANDLQQFRHVTFPGLHAEISVALVTTLISAIKIFDVVYVTTKGGPATQTETVSMWLYQNAFRLNRTGYASAMAVIQSAIVLSISYVVLTMRLRAMQTTAEGGNE